MKTKIIQLLAVSFFVAAAMPVQAQIKRVNYFQNNPALGGEVVIKNSVKEVIGNQSYTNFVLTAPSAGEYYVNFWLLPIQYENGTFSVFKVLVNGTEAGGISPVKENWQSIGLDGNRRIALQKGENTVSVVANVPEVPEVEFIRLSKAISAAKISSSSYDTYLTKAKDFQNGKREISLEMENEEIAVEPSGIERIVGTGADGSVAYLNVPVKYSFRTSLYFTEGQEIFITSQSIIQHVIDFYIQESSAVQTQYLSWLNVSEPAINNANIQIATIRVTIPRTGYYMIDARSYASGVIGTVNLNVNGAYFYSGSPIYYSGRNVVQPADGKKYATLTMAMADGADTYLFVEGAGSTPGKVVAYNDDAPSAKITEYGLKNRDSYLEKVYAMPTSGVNVASYSSSYPETTCHIIAKIPCTDTREAIVFRAPADTKDLTGIARTNVMETAVYPNPVDMYSVLNISGKALESIEVYDISGSLIGSKKINGESVEIPVIDLNISETGVYFLKLTNEEGTVTKKLIVK